MLTSDPIADMLSRIRNAISVGKTEVSLPHSNLKEKVADILVANGFLSGIKMSAEPPFKSMTITINQAGQPPKITEITRLSKPGRRQYVRSGRLPVVKRGRGIVVVSTSHGVMTGSEARAQRLGGELICKVY